MRSSRLIFALVIAALDCSTSRSAEPAIRVVGDLSRSQAVEVIGLAKSDLAELARLPGDDPSWPKRLAVYVAGESVDPSAPAMLGSYAIEGTALRFTPTYSLRSGMKYRVVYRGAATNGSPSRDITK